MGTKRHSQKLNDLEYFDESEAYSDLATLSELGLPNIKASRVYLAGVRSRVAAAELSTKLNFDIEVPLRRINHFLIENFEQLETVCSELTVRWLNSINQSEQSNRPKEVVIQNISIDGPDLPIFDSLFIKKVGENYYACNGDYSFKRLITINSKEVKNLANDLGVYFEYDPVNDNWQMKVRDPHIRVIGELDNYI